VTIALPLFDNQLWHLLRFVWNHPLNAKGRGTALGRVVRWQLASRLGLGPIALPFVEGTSLLASPGMTGITGNWYCGLHDVKDMGFVLHLLRPGDHFVDGGANIGSYTILAAGAVGAAVTCVEPIPATFNHLHRNISINELWHGVSARRVGLSDVAGTLKFTKSLGTANHVLSEGEAESSTDVPVETLDDLVGSNPPVLIKIDVEGHERRVLMGAERTLADRRVLAVIMETNGSGVRYGVDDDQLTALMSSHGFSACDYDPFERRLEPSVADVSGNTIFVRDKTAVEQRVRASRRYRLVNGTI
jgi:FkbM family methyltransferase